jgi:hypothetical protein
MELMYVINYSSFSFSSVITLISTSMILQTQVEKAKVTNNAFMNPLLPKMHNGSKERMN